MVSPRWRRSQKPVEVRREEDRERRAKARARRAAIATSQAFASTEEARAFVSGGYRGACPACGGVGKGGPCDPYTDPSYAQDPHHGCELCDSTGGLSEDGRPLNPSVR